MRGLRSGSIEGSDVRVGVLAVAVSSALERFVWWAVQGGQPLVADPGEDLAGELMSERHVVFGREPLAQPQVQIDRGVERSP